MIERFKQLGLICFLICAASALLLFSDQGQRKGQTVRHKAYPSIAVFQIASTFLIDAHVGGIVDRLDEKGYLAPDRKNLKLYNPQGDTGVANAIARDIANSSFDVVITSSTVALQTFANANVSTQKPHVFGAVTNPYSAGVGITGSAPHQHPPYLAGIGTFQPVRHSITLAREMNPALEKIGVVWNPAEQSSESCLIEARETVKEIGIRLIEAVATNTSEVYEATQSLIAKEVDAIWIGGDVVATASIGLIINLATEAGIPVFTNDPTDAPKGALFGLGADYRTVGGLTADIAIAILEGQSPAHFAIENVVPEHLEVNYSVLEKLSPTWCVTDSIEQRLKRQKAQSAKQQTLREKLVQPEGRPWKIALSYMVPAPIFDMAIAGFKEGLSELGLTEGENLEMSVRHANGDLSLLPQVTRSLVSQQPDILVAMSTPSLASAIAHAEDMDIVFGIVSAPLEAGAGESFETHLPNVTGIVQLIPTPELFDWMQRVFPLAKKIGVLYNPSEANSVKELGDIQRMLDERGLKLEAVAASTTSEVPEAIQGLLSREVDLVFAIADNTVANGMPAMIGAARQKGVPVMAEDIALMGTGAFFSCAPGPYSDGKDLAKLVARVLAGESPEWIPIQPGKRNELTLDMLAFKKAGKVPPPEMLEEVDVVFHYGQSRGAPAKIALVSLVDNPLLSNAIEGVKAGLESLGLKEDVDFKMTRYSAQGDFSMLPQLLDRAVMGKPDVLVTVTTPAMIAAVNRKLEVPVVYTVASDPVAINLFSADKQPDNVTGIHDDPAMGELLLMARKWDDAFTSVGIVYDAAEPNARLSLERLERAAQEQGVPIVKVSATTLADLTLATRALVQKGVSAIILGTDNLVTTGFPAIYQEASRADIPVYSTSIELIEQGAAGAIGNNYFEWGRLSGVQAARVLIGVSPERLPIQVLPPRARIERESEPKQQGDLPVHAAAGDPNTPVWPESKKVRLVMYSETEFAERSHEGFLAGLAKAGLVPGEKMDFKALNAQGDMSTLSSIMQSVSADQPDLVLVVSTPALQAALRQVADSFPVVFSGVGDAVKAGAGQSERVHHPNVTGITTRSPFDEMARLIRQVLPDVRRVGTLFTPAEINSVLYKNWFSEALHAQGLELVSVPVTSSSEITQAAAELVRQDIQLVAQVVDNLTRPGFALIARQAAENHLPVFVFDSDQMKEGGTLALARDYHEAALEAAEMAVAVLKGASAGGIPFRNASQTQLIVDQDKARQFGLQMDPKRMKGEFQFIHDSKQGGQ